MTQEERKVKVSDIFTDYKYQRLLDESWVRKLVREYDPSKVNQIILSNRDNGGFYVIDGNHTIEATRRAVGEDAELSAKVFRGLTPSEEADMFYSYNKNKKPLTFGDRLKALVATGDEQAVRYVTLLDEEGIVWDYRGKGGRACKFTAHSGAFGMFKKYGEDIFKKALVLFNQTKEVSSFDGTFLLGFIVIFAKVDNVIDTNRLVSVINRTPKDTIARYARLYLDATTGGGKGEAVGRAYASAFMELYNKKLGDSKRLRFRGVQ